MGFFDDLKRNVTDAGQKTVQKTKDLAEVTRMNSQISQNESKIKNFYYDIGKLYVSKHSSDCEEDFRAMVESISSLEKENEDLRSRIQELKGVQRCEVCGAEVPKGTAFCSKCGAAMPGVEIHQAPADSVRCPSCGNMVSRGMRFCINCGHAMTAPEDTAEAVPAEEPVSEEAANAGAPRVCPQCGAAIPGNVRFCIRCGQQL